MDGLKSGQMHETRYSADPELKRPLRLLRSMMDDLRTAMRMAVPFLLTSLRARHRRSVLGYVWLLLPMLATTLACVFLQSRRLVVFSAAEGVPFAAFVLSGVALWQCFAEAINAPLQHLNQHRQLVIRSNVPHEALMLAGLAEVLLMCAARTAILLPMLVLALDVPLQVTQLAAVVGVLLLVFSGFAAGVLLAPLGLLYQDVQRSLTLLLAFGFVFTPVVYRANDDHLLRANPVAALLDTTRAWLLGVEPRADIALIGVLTFVMLPVAAVLYRLARPHVIARLG